MIIDDCNEIKYRSKCTVERTVVGHVFRFGQPGQKRSRDMRQRHVVQKKKKIKDKIKNKTKQLQRGNPIRASSRGICKRSLPFSQPRTHTLTHTLSSLQVHTRMQCLLFHIEETFLYPH